MKFTVALAAILCLLFWRSFIPSQVPFSNDGPLGTVVSAQTDPRTSWSGGWQDLNWIGSEYPTPGPSVSMGYRMLIFLGPRMWFVVALAILALSLPFQVVTRRMNLEHLTKAQRFVWCQYCAAVCLYVSLFAACAIRHFLIEYTDPSPLLGLGGMMMLWGFLMLAWQESRVVYAPE